MMRKILALILLFALPLAAAPKKHSKKGQTQPDPARVVQIQEALTAHGYEPGNSWGETQEVCRKIADEHGWQNMHAPDTRVLILLGLAPNLDPEVATLPGNALDRDERKWVEEHGLPKNER